MTLELRPSEGDVENLTRLRDPASGVDFGFLQGGLTGEDESPGLASLGTMFYEPPGSSTGGTARPPRECSRNSTGSALSIGPVLSGTRALATIAPCARRRSTRRVRMIRRLSPDEAAAATDRGADRRRHHR